MGKPREFKLAASPFQRIFRIVYLAHEVLWLGTIFGLETFKQQAERIGHRKIPALPVLRPFLAAGNVDALAGKVDIGPPNRRGFGQNSVIILRRPFAPDTGMPEWMREPRWPRFRKIRGEWERA